MEVLLIDSSSLFFLDLCVDAGCEDICVSEPNKIKPTCLCRLGYSLNDDGRTCTGNNQASRL